MVAVMIGVDPHKASHTAVAINAAEEPLGELRVRASAVQAERLLAWAQAWPQRTWAVEGAGGVGHLLAQQLLAAGERVLDVPPKLAARVRLLATGNINKNDPNDARSVAVAALRSAGCQEARRDDHAVVLKIWSKRYRDLGRTRTQVACRLHQVLCELIPGGVGRQITAGQATHILGSITPSTAVEAARRELAAEFTEDLRGIDAAIRETRKKLTTAVRAAGTSLTGLFGVGPVIAAAVIGDVRHVARFPGRDHFAAYDGTAPIEVSSGGRKVYRAVPARKPAAQPRHPHGRGHPDPPPAQPGPRLLRQETGRRQDSQRGPARPEAADQRRHLRLPPSRRPPRRSQCQQPGRATGERLTHQRGRLTPPAPALRESHSRACHPPYDPSEGPRRCSRSRAAAIPSERAARSRTGRSPAAQRRQQGVLDPATREPIMPCGGKAGQGRARAEAALRRITTCLLTLKQRGVRSVLEQSFWSGALGMRRTGDLQLPRHRHGNTRPSDIR
jgi:transposase